MSVNKERARLGGISRGDPHNEKRISEQRDRLAEALREEREQKARARREAQRRRIASILPKCTAEEVERLVDLTVDSLFDPFAD